MIGAPHSLPGWAVMKIRIMLFEGFFFEGLVFVV